MSDDDGGVIDGGLAEPVTEPIDPDDPDIIDGEVIGEDETEAGLVPYDPDAAIDAEIDTEVAALTPTEHGARPSGANLPATPTGGAGGVARGGRKRRAVSLTGRGAGGGGVHVSLFGGLGFNFSPFSGWLSGNRLGAVNGSVSTLSGNHLGSGNAGIQANYGSAGTRRAASGRRRRW